MDTRDVAFFRRVAETGSLNKASRIEYSNVTTSMRRLDALELEFGVKLVTRSSQGVFLTPAGEAFCRSSGELLQTYEELRESVRLAASDREPRLRVALTPMVQSSLLRTMWSLLEERYPGTVICLSRYGSTAEEKVRLFDEFGVRYDILPCYEGTKGVLAKYRFRPLFSEALVLGVPSGHPFSKRSVVRAADLAGKSILVPDPKTNYRVASQVGEMKRFVPHLSFEIVPEADYGLFNRAVCDRLPVLIPASWSDMHPMIRGIPLDFGAGTDFSVPFGYRFLEGGVNPDGKPAEKIAESACQGRRRRI